MSVITVNGKEYVVPDGSSVQMNNNVIMVNGRVLNTGDEKLSGVVRLEVVGEIKSVSSSSSIHVHGNVAGSVSASGSVQCGDVSGHVKANGSVTCKNVSGNVEANGSVTRL